MFKIWLNLQQSSAGTKATAVETHINKYVRTAWALQATCIICLCYCSRRVHPSHTASLWPIPIILCRYIHGPPKVKVQFAVGFWSYRLYKFRASWKIYGHLPHCVSESLSEKRYEAIWHFRLSWRWICRLRSPGIKRVAIGVYVRF
jgi:hypothetical protein